MVFEAELGTQRLVPSEARHQESAPAGKALEYQVSPPDFEMAAFLVIAAGAAESESDAHLFGAWWRVADHPRADDGNRTRILSLGS